MHVLGLERMAKTIKQYKIETRIGPAHRDYGAMVGLGETLLRLEIVEYDRNKREVSSFIQVCNGGQMFWSRYRVKYET